MAVLLLIHIAEKSMFRKIFFKESVYLMNLDLLRIVSLTLIKYFVMVKTSCL